MDSKGERLVKFLAAGQVEFGLRWKSGKRSDVCATEIERGGQEAYE